MVIVEKLVEWRLAGKTKVLGENLPQRHFVNHKSHMTRPGCEPGPQRLEVGFMYVFRDVQWLIGSKHFCVLQGVE
jgi:hypothetical protein